MKKDFFGQSKMDYYRNRCPVLALDEYKKDQGQDDFSRKQVWFYVYGDEEIEKEFRSELKSMLKSRFVDDEIDWDFMTLYPTHVKGGINQHMRSLLESIAPEVGIEYGQVIERNKTVEQNHELDTKKAKAVNIEGSIDVKDFEGENVILIDNISLTGVSLLHGVEKLLENGAERVFGVCLGLGKEFPNKEQINRDKKASELLQ